MGDFLQGKLANVWAVPAGSVVAADIAAGVTSIPINDPDDFDPGGGDIIVGENSTAYSYSGIDTSSSPANLLLTSATTEAYESPTVIQVVPYSEETLCLVVVTGQDDEDALEVIVPNSIATNLEKGTRAEDLRESVYIILDPASRYVLASIEGEAPTITDDSLPDGVTALIPQAAPESSPAPTAIGGVGIIQVSWPSAVSDWPVQYNLYASTTQGFAPSPANLVLTTYDTIVSINAIGGVKLAYGINYYFKLVAFNDFGAAPTGAETSASLFKVTSADIVTNYVYTGQLIADQITGGTIRAAITLSAALKTGDSGARFVADATGAYLYGPDGVTQNFKALTADGSVFIKGTAELDVTNINGKMSIRGLTNEISAGSSLQLKGGVSDPLQIPAAVVGFDHVQLNPTVPTSSGSISALVRGASKWVVGQSLSAANSDLVQFDPTTGAETLRTPICCEPNYSRYTIYSMTKDGSGNYWAWGNYAQNDLPGQARTNLIPSSRLTSYTYNGNNILDDWVMEASGGTSSMYARTGDSSPIGDSVIGYMYAATTNSYAFARNASAFPVTAGQVYASSGYIKNIDTAAQGQGRNVQMLMRWYDANGTYLGDTLQNFGGLNVNSGWVRCSMSGTAPAGATQARVYFGITGITNNGYGVAVGMSNMLWETGSALQAYFDGAYGAAGGKRYYYNGAYNRSSSVEQAYVPSKFAYQKFSYNETTGACSHLARADQASQGAVGTDGSGNVIAAWTDGTNWAQATLSSSGTAISINNAAVLPSVNPSGSGPGSASVVGQRPVSMMRGDFDYGSGTNKLIIQSYASDGSTPWFLGWNTSNAREQDSDWTGEAGAFYCAAWDGANFWSSTPDGKLTKFTGSKYLASDSSQWWVSYDWYNTTGSYRTAQSPKSTFTMRRRAKVTVTGATLPVLGTGSDPNQIRFYIGRGTTDPGTIGMIRQYAGTQITTDLNNVAFVGATNPAVNNFPNSAPAKIVDKFGATLVDGNGFNSADPIGTVKDWFGPPSTFPRGYVQMDFGAYSRTVYPDAWAVLNPANGGGGGTGDGSTTFNVPDGRGRTTIGVGTGTGGYATNHPVGQYYGEEQHLLTYSESGLRDHSHSLGPGQSFGMSFGANNSTAAVFKVSVASTNGGSYQGPYIANPVGNYNADAAHNNMQPSVACYKIIRISLNAIS